MNKSIKRKLEDSLDLKNKRIRYLPGDDIEQFPDEVLENIFHHMNGESLLNCALVCNRWKTLTDNEIFWEKVCRSEILDLQDILIKQSIMQGKHFWKELYHSWYISKKNVDDWKLEDTHNIELKKTVFQTKICKDLIITTDSTSSFRMYSLNNFKLLHSYKHDKLIGDFYCLEVLGVPYIMFLAFFDYKVGILQIKNNLFSPLKLFVNSSRDTILKLATCNDYFAFCQPDSEIRVYKILQEPCDQHYFTINKISFLKNSDPINVYIWNHHLIFIEQKNLNILDVKEDGVKTISKLQLNLKSENELFTMSSTVDFLLIFFNEIFYKICKEGDGYIIKHCTSLEEEDTVPINFKFFSNIFVQFISDKQEIIKMKPASEIIDFILANKKHPQFKLLKKLSQTDMSFHLEKLIFIFCSTNQLVIYKYSHSNIKNSLCF